VPVAEPEPEPVVGAEQERRDLRVVAEPRVAVAAGGRVEGVEVGAGDPEPGLRGEQREHPEVGDDRLPGRDGLGDRGSRLARGRGERVGVVQLGEQLREPVAGRLSRRLLAVDQQGADGRDAVLEGNVGDDLAGEALLLVAVAVAVPREVGRRVVEQFGERRRELAAQVGEAGVAREEVGLVGVVHLDGVVVSELTHPVVAPVGREPGVHDEREVGGVDVRVPVVAHVDCRAREVGAAERHVVPGDRRPVGLVNGLYQRRVADVALLGRGLVEPDDLVADRQADARADEPRLTGQRVPEVAEFAVCVDVNESSFAAREPTGNGPAFAREPGGVPGVSLVVVERVAELHYGSKRPLRV